MAVQTAKHEDKKPAPPPAPKAATAQKGKAINPNLNTPDVLPAGGVLGPLPKDQPASDIVVINPLAASDVAGGFTPGTVPGTDKISAIKTDTPTYGTETPPRQTPPTSIGGTAVDQALKHSPPSASDANGAKIVSAAPTCSGISPTTGTAGSTTPLVVTLTGTNFDRATYAAVNGVVQSNSAYASATSLTVALDISKMPAGTYNITAVNSAGSSANRSLTLS